MVLDREREVTSERRRKVKKIRGKKRRTYEILEVLPFSKTKRRVKSTK